LPYSVLPDPQLCICAPKTSFKGKMKTKGNWLHDG
jgi:hypothetical protein